MRIYFGVNGIGRGHAIRSFRLAERLSQYRYEVYMSSYGDGYDTLKILNSSKRCCRIMKLEGYTYAWLSKKLDWKRTILKGILNSNRLFKHFLEELNNIYIINPDLIISDSRISTCLASMFLEKKYVLISNQLSVFHKNVFLRHLIRRLFSYLWGRPETIFITDLPPPYTISYINSASLRNLFKKIEVEYVGLLLNDESIKPVEYDSRDIDVLFVVSAPSGDRESFYVDTLKVARELGRRGYRVTIIGHGNRIGNVGYVSIEGWVDNPFEYLSRSRLVVLRGGQTAILESILHEVPMLVVPAPHQTEQEGNAVSVYRLGIGSYISYTKYYRNPSMVVNRIEEILSKVDEYMNSLGKIRRVMLNIKGVDKIIGFIRRASEGD